MRILVTGASGFVAPFLVRELLDGDHDVVLTAPGPYKFTGPKGSLDAEVCDLTDFGATKRLIGDVRPEAVVHLASLSHVGQSWQDRANLVNININTTSHVCQAIEILGRTTTMLYASSGQVYRPREGAGTAQDETALPDPLTPFGSSKLAAEYVVRSFASETFLPYIVRPFNLIGPGQSRAYACSAFAHRILQTSDGGAIPVGNLDSVRDFCDVRDAVRAYRMILEKKPEDQLFVIGTGRRTKMQEVFDAMAALSGKQVTPFVDKNLLRPVDPKAVVADPGRAERVLGWRPAIKLKTTLGEIYEEASGHYG